MSVTRTFCKPPVVLTDDVVRSCRNDEVKDLVLRHLRVESADLVITRGNETEQTEPAGPGSSKILIDTIYNADTLIETGKRLMSIAIEFLTADGRTATEVALSWSSR